MLWEEGRVIKEVQGQCFSICIGLRFIDLIIWAIPYTRSQSFYYKRDCTTLADSLGYRKYSNRTRIVCKNKVEIRELRQSVCEWTQVTHQKKKDGSSLLQETRTKYAKIFRFNCNRLTAHRVSCLTNPEELNILRLKNRNGPV